MPAPTFGPGTIGKGIAFAYSTDGSTYITVAHLTDIKLPETSTGKVEVMTFDGTFTGKIPGWQDASDAEIKVLYDKTSTAAIYALENGSALNCKATHVDGSTLVWTGFVVGFGTATPIKDKVENTIKFAVSTAPVFTAGT